MANEPRETPYFCKKCGAPMKRYGAARYGYLICSANCTKDKNGQELFFEEDFK